MNYISIFEPWNEKISARISARAARRKGWASGSTCSFNWNLASPSPLLLRGMGGGGSVHRLLESGNHEIKAWNQESKTVFITIMFL